MGMREGLIGCGAGDGWMLCVDVFWDSCAGRNFPPRLLVLLCSKMWSSRITRRVLTVLISPYQTRVNH
jgi:hypothetical protein